MIDRVILPNGVTILHQKTKSLAASIGIWVRLGSRNETESERGYTHFLEHMVFKGTTKRTAKELASRVERVGGYMNAATSREYTYFYITVIKEELELAIDILSDMVTDPLLSEADIQNEIGVVLEEMKSYGDDPEEYLHDFYYKNFMLDSSLGLDIIGNKKSVSGITESKIRAYFESYYTPENILVSISSENDFSYIRELVEKYMGRISKVGKKPTFERLKGKNYGKFLEKRKLEQVNFILGTDGIGKDVRLGTALSLLNTIFGGTMSSRLFQKIREEKGLCYSINSYSSSYSDSGLFSISCGTSKKNFEIALSTILGEIENLKKNLITAEELRDAKSNQKGSLVIGYEHPDNKMTDIAIQELYYQTYYSIEERIKLLDSITLEEICNLIEKLYGHGNLHLSVVGDIKEKKFDALKF